MKWPGSDKNPREHKIFLSTDGLHVPAARPSTEKNIEHSFIFEENSRTLRFFPPRTAPLT